MKKKLTALVLALVMLLGISACTTKTDGDTSNTTAPQTGTQSEDTTAAKEESGYTGTLSALVEAIYEAQPVELRLSPITPIDLSVAENVKYYLGLDDTTGITEAYFSEPMMSSQAYSLCVVRTSEGTDTDAVAQSIFDSVDTRKWVCVEANNMIVATSGDVILLVMVDSELGETLCADLYTAFTAIAGTDGKKLEK